MSLSRKRRQSQIDISKWLSERYLLIDNKGSDGWLVAGLKKVTAQRVIRVWAVCIRDV